MRPDGCAECLGGYGQTGSLWKRRRDVRAQWQFAPLESKTPS